MSEQFDVEITDWLGQHNVAKLWIESPEDDYTLGAWVPLEPAMKAFKLPWPHRKGLRESLVDDRTPYRLVLDSTGHAQVLIRWDTVCAQIVIPSRTDLGHRF